MEGSATTSKADNSRDPGKDAMKMITAYDAIDVAAPTTSDNLVLLIKEQDAAANEIEGSELIDFTEAEHDESVAKFEPDTVM